MGIKKLNGHIFFKLAQLSHDSVALLRLAWLHTHTRTHTHTHTHTHTESQTHTHTHTHTQGTDP